MKKQHAEKCRLVSTDRALEAPDENGMKNCDCDGYHTFDELYEHRAVLFIALCKIIDDELYGPEWTIWRSKKHADDTMYDGMFILGIDKEKGSQVTYHLEMDKWEETNFAETLDKAPEFDGHTSDDVLERLKKL